MINDIDKLKACIRIDEKYDSWTCFNIVNCYSYALRMLYDVRYLNPGQIAGLTKLEQYSDNDLISYITSDIEALGMTIRESTLDEIITDKNSWKIAVMNTGIMPKKDMYDFHFLRQDENGAWYQKFSDEQFPTRLDENNRIIEDPEIARYSEPYHLVGYFVISKINQREPC